MADEPFSGARVKGLYLNNEAVQAIYQPAAHTDGDSFVHFRSSDVIATGDILDLRHFPVIDTTKGGTINGTINALTRLIEMSVGPVPLTWHADRTLIVPGHGRLADQGEVVEYRDMLVMIRDRIDDLVKKGQESRTDQGREPNRRIQHAVPDRRRAEGCVHHGGAQNPECQAIIPSNWRRP